MALPLDSAFNPRIAEIAASLGLPNSTLRTIATFGPWLPISLIGIRVVLSFVERIAADDRVILVVLLGLVTAIIVLPLVAPIITDDESVVSLFNQAAWLAGWLLLWPTVRWAGSGHVMSARDGLWWRCLLLLPCSVSVLSFGSYNQLAVPIAAWIATRYGARALPALSLALVPMMLCIALDLSFIVVRPGLGAALAALLAAMFVIDAKLRASILAQDRLTVAQMVVLCLLTVELEIGIPALKFKADLYPLAIMVLAFVGLSRTPIRRLVSVFAAVELTGVVLEWASKGAGLPAFRFDLGYPGLAGFVNVVLVLVITRLIRSSVDLPLDGRRTGHAPQPSEGASADSPDRDPGWSELRARILQIDLPQPVQRVLQSIVGFPGLTFVAGLIALDGFVFSVSLAGISLDPFVRYQLFLAAIALGALGRMGRLPWAQRSRFFVRVPQPHRTALLIGLAVLVLAAVPSVNLSIEPFQVRFGSPFAGGLANALVAGTFYYVGHALPDLIAAGSLAGGSRTNVWRTVPVKMGVGAAILCITIAIGAVVGRTAYEFGWFRSEETTKPGLTRFRCQGSKDPTKALKSYFNPKTGQYDRTEQVPLSECPIESAK